LKATFVTSEQPSYFKKESKGAKAGSVLSRLVPGNDRYGAILGIRRSPEYRPVSAESGRSAVEKSPEFCNMT
jgi:hypothetical protein